MKALTGVHDAPPHHWVGDAFRVRSLFSYNDDFDLSPFILLDHAERREFTPAVAPRGVGWHPHRGFETVTIVYEGEVEHHDSRGNRGVIGPGDVQWMTAASGILHEEFQSREFTANGGAMHMVQLWVNLPARDKMSEPGYQTLLRADIPVVALADNAGTLRVIAGDFGNAHGAAKTHTPVDVFDVALHAGKGTTIPVTSGRTLAIVVLAGTLRINGSHDARAGQLVTFDRKGTDVNVGALEEATFLILSGEPLDEPVYGYGPFVMNTRDEIVQAIEDFNAGRFGAPAPA
jgi:redox-sensitive bicupin YhaK (pirin superfamily)